jgi:hypothetical protein
MLCGSLVVYLKTSMCSSWRRFHARRIGRAPALPWLACGSICRPCRHNGARDEKSVGGGVAIFAVEGVMAVLYQPVLAQTGLAVGSARPQQAHSVSCEVVMAWMSTN